MFERNSPLVWLHLEVIVIGPIHTGREQANLRAIPLMLLASDVNTPICNSRFYLLAFALARPVWIASKGCTCLVVMARNATSWHQVFSEQSADHNVPLTGPCASTWIFLPYRTSTEKFRRLVATSRWRCLMSVELRTKCSCCSSKTTTRSSARHLAAATPGSGWLSITNKRRCFSLSPSVSLTRLCTVVPAKFEFVLHTFCLS